MFGYPVLISIDFDDFTSPFTPQFLFRLRRYIKHSRQYFISYPNTESRQKYSAARRILNSLLGVWISRWNTISRVWCITSTNGPVPRQITQRLYEETACMDLSLVMRVIIALFSVVGIEKKEQREKKWGRTRASFSHSFSPTTKSLEQATC